MDRIRDGVIARYQSNKDKIYGLLSVNKRSLFLLIVFIVVLKYLIYPQLRARDPCKNIHDTDSELVSFNNNYDYPSNTDSMRNYKIITAYNCCCIENKSPFVFPLLEVNTCAMKRCIDMGVRCLDFEVYSKYDKPFIGIQQTDENQDKKFNMHYTFTGIKFDDIIPILKTELESNTRKHMLILHIRLKSLNIKMYNNLAILLRRLRKHIRLDDNNTKASIQDVKFTKNEIINNNRKLVILIAVPKLDPKIILSRDVGYLLLNSELIKYVSGVVNIIRCDRNTLKTIETIQNNEYVKPRLTTCLPPNIDKILNSKNTSIPKMLFENGINLIGFSFHEKNHVNLKKHYQSIKMVKFYNLVHTKISNLDKKNYNDLPPFIPIHEDKVTTVTKKNIYNTVEVPNNYPKLIQDILQ